jgi:2-methoxy-6-polyprenyl-1,4-benzoquinol methylase
MNFLENSKDTLLITDKLKEQNLAPSAESDFKITVCDINENMLRVGEQRSKSLPFADRLVWKVGNAENLVNEKDNTYDVYTIAFGIRNCTNLDKVIKEAYRVLKPGGRFLVMEFSKVDDFMFKK